MGPSANNSELGFGRLDRRQLLRAGAAVAGSCLFQSRQSWATIAAAGTTQTKQQYNVGVCDWMMLKRQKLGAFPLAKDVGADGVEVDMGSLGQRDSFENALADPAVQTQFLDAARENGLDICSLAMSAFYAQSFGERPTVQQMLDDCIETMHSLKVKVAFLPLGVRGDLVKYPELRPAIVARLKAVAPAAEKSGVVIGLETALDAENEIKLLEEVASPAVKIYFNFENPLQGNRDLHSELRKLGTHRICQIHCTDRDGVLLRDNPRIDMPKVKATLDEMNWSGWLVIERSRDARKSRDVRHNFGANVAFMKSIFQSN